MNARKILASLSVGVVLCTCSATTGEAGLFPCLWDALFGNCCGGCFFPTGCAPGSCGATYYYGPACAGGQCGVVYSAACAPCGQPALAADCPIEPIPATGGAAGSASQAPADPWKKRKQTYSDENGKAAAPRTGTGDESDDFRSRGASGGRKRDDEQDSTRTDFKPATGAAESALEGGAAESTPIAPRDASGTGAKPKAPATRFREDEEVDGSAPESGGKKSSDKRLQPRPKVELDAKVAWRTAPARQRLELSSSSEEKRLVRRAAYPKSDWVDSNDAAAVARK